MVVVKSTETALLVVPVRMTVRVKVPSLSLTVLVMVVKRSTAEARCTAGCRPASRA